MKQLNTITLSHSSIIALLNYRNPKNTQLIHQATGADFAADLVGCVCVGSFTANTIETALQQMNQGGADTDNNKIVWVIFEAPRYYYKGAAGEHRSIETENRIALYHYGKLSNEEGKRTGYYSNGFDTCNSAGDLQKFRKVASYFCVIVMKKGEIAQPLTVDKFTRYQMGKAYTFGIWGKPGTYSNRIAIKNGNKSTEYRFDKIPAEEVDTIADKNGYLLKLFKDGQERKLYIFKKNRRAEEARKTDKAADLENLVKMFNDIMTRAAAELVSTEPENMRTAKDICYYIQSWDFRPLQDTINRIRANEFKSVEEYNRSIQEAAGAYLRAREITA